MGISIDLHIYDAPKLLKELEKWGAKDLDLTRKILEECGHFFGDEYVLLNNEEYETGNPYYLISDLLDSAFKKENSFDIFLDNKNKYSREGISYIEIDEIAEKLGIKLNDDEDDEDDEEDEDEE